MGILSSEDRSGDRISDRFYSLSTDMSESDSSASDFSCQVSDHLCSSSTLTSSSIAGSELDLSSGFPAPLTALMPETSYTRIAVHQKRETEFSEIEMMKEQFAKLLLGEDMTGGGKGLCSALAISNAITNLSATVFGDLWKLEPLEEEKKAMWYREMNWLLPVSNSIVQLVPSFQEVPGGGNIEVMVPQPRSDLYVNLPALKKLDAMLLGTLEEFHDSEFYYVDGTVIISAADENETCSPSALSQNSSTKQEEKWWLPFPRVPPNGLPAAARMKLQKCRECTSQLLKAALAINITVLAEMEVPDVYLHSLPKSGKALLGELIYSCMHGDEFSPERLLDYLDLSSEYSTMELANRFEASVHIWRKKYHRRHSLSMKDGKSSLGGKIKGLIADIEKYNLLAQHAETLLQSLRLRFPGLGQTALDMSKILYNKDVGKSILESYSRAMERLALSILARIDDLLYIDDATKQQAATKSIASVDLDRTNGFWSKQMQISPTSSTSQHKHCASPFQAPTYHSAGSPQRRTPPSSLSKEEKFVNLPSSIN